MGLISNVVEKAKNDAFLHIMKGVLTRHMVNAGVVGSESAALDLIETGKKLPGPIPSLNTSGIKVATAVTGQFANIINVVQTFITTNLEPNLQLLITELPQILQLISMFEAL